MNVCDWCWREISDDQVVPMTTKVERFDPKTGQDIYRYEKHNAFCSTRCRTNWLREP